MHMRMQTGKNRRKEHSTTIWQRQAETKLHSDVLLAETNQAANVQRYRVKEIDNEHWLQQTNHVNSSLSSQNKLISDAWCKRS